MLIGDPPTASSTGLPIWGIDCEDDLVCRAVTQETPDVRTFHFAAERPAQFRFEPGQFLTLELPIDGAAVHRCYTISSPPTRPETVSISAKRVPQGPASNWLHDAMRPGLSLRATGPAGEFVLPRAPSGKLLFLSGGIGATPAISMIRALYDRAEDRDILYVHSARTPADIPFRDELALMARRLPRLRVVHIVERPGDEPAWSGLTGRLRPEALALLAPDLLERDTYCCGPAPYMAAVRAMLDAAGFNRQNYHEESFTFERLPGGVIEDVSEATAQSIAGFNVTFVKSNKTITCESGATILDAARRAGMRLPFACSKGVCGTCKSRMVSGRVDMRHGGGIRPREIDQGLVLICCSRPLEDLVIDR